MVWDAATCCGNLNYKLDEPTSFFFFSLFQFFSFLRACLALWKACRLVPMCLPCARKEIYLSSLSPSTCVEQNAWPGNRVVKCADAYKCRRKLLLKCRYHCRDPAILKCGYYPGHFCLDLSPGYLFLSKSAQWQLDLNYLPL